MRHRSAAAAVGVTAALLVGALSAVPLGTGADPTPAAAVSAAGLSVAASAVEPVLAPVPQTGLMAGYRLDGSDAGQPHSHTVVVLCSRLRSRLWSDLLSGCQEYLRSSRAGRFGADAESAWAVTMGAGVTVMVVDFPIDFRHEDLAANIDVTRSPGLASTALGSIDHGTAMASIIAARDNSVGMRGVAPRAQLTWQRIYGANDFQSGWRWSEPHGTFVGDGSLTGTWVAACAGSVSDAMGGPSRAHPHVAHYYSFSLTQPSTVTIDLTSQADPYLLLRSGHNAQSGTTLAADDDSGDGLNARMVKTLGAGEYTIEATTAAANTEGDYTLAVAGIGTAETAAVAGGGADSFEDERCGRGGVGHFAPPDGSQASLEAAVINHSYSTTDAHSPTRDREAYFYDIYDTLSEQGWGGLGTVNVTSASREYPNQPVYYLSLTEENSHPALVAACTVNADGTRPARPSARGPNLWVCSMPAELMATNNDSYQRLLYATSSAASAMVSGATALVRAANPGLGWRDVKLILAESAQHNHPGSAGWQQAGLKRSDPAERYRYHHSYGFGVIDAGAAVQLALDWASLPPYLRELHAAPAAAQDIPDDGSAVSGSLAVASGIGFVEYAEAEIDFDAPYFRDLRVELVSPSGTVSTLSEPLVGLQASAYTHGPDCNVADECGITGKLRFGTSANLGESASGTWLLRIADEKPNGRTATLNSWRLRLYGHDTAHSPPAGAPPTVAVSGGPAAVEGGTASFTFTASPAPAAPLDVSFTMSSDGRFGAWTGNRKITIPASGAVTLMTETSGDRTDEPDGSVTASLSSADGYAVSATDGSASVAVLDDDMPPPAVTIAGGPKVTEGEPATFTLSASPPPARPLTLWVLIVDTADPVGDGYHQGVTIPVTGSATLSVATTDDSASEPDRRVHAEVETGTGYTLSWPWRASVVVADDHDPLPAAPEVSVTAGSGITEGADAQFTVTASPAPAAPLTVDVTVSQSGDFGASTGTQTVTVPTNGTATVTVTTSDDGVVESDGSVSVAVNTGSSYTVSATDGSASVSVADDDGSTADGCAAALSGSGKVQASWDSECISAARDGRFARFFTFSLDAQAAVRIDLTSQHDTYLFLRSGPDSRSGGAVAHDDDSGSGLNSRISRTLSAGDYTIEATTYRRARVGKFTLTTTGIPDQTSTSTTQISVAAGSGIIEGGDASFTVTASPAPSAPLAVDLTVGQAGDFGVTTGSRTVTVPTSGTASVTVSTSDDDVDELDGSVSMTVNSGSGYTVSGTAGSASVAVSDDDDPPAGCGSAAVLAAQARANHDALPNTASNRKERNDWWRAWIALSGTTGTYNTPLTAAEARVLETGDSRWEPYRAALECQEGTPPPTVVPEVSVTAGAGVTEGGDASFTVIASPAPAQPLSVDVTVAQVGDFGASTGSRAVTIPTGGSAALTVGTSDDSVDETDGSVSVSVGAGSGYTVSGTAGSATVNVADDDDPPPVVVPEVSVTAGAGVTEGGDASFTVTASPAPSAPLSINVSVTQAGDYGVTTGSRTVTVPTSGSVTVSVPTADDDVDELDGSVTVAVVSGSGYTVSSTQGSASVGVSDDDDPPPATPQISVTAGSGITEGANASFTVTASPAPAQPLAVRVTISQQGDYGVTTGSRTVTIGTSGAATLTVATSDDDTDEADGSVTVTINSSDGYTVSSAHGTASVAVSDDDDPPPADLPEVSVADGSVVEGAFGPLSLLEFSVTLSEVSTQDVTVRYVIRSGTAFNGLDYWGGAGQVTIWAGFTQATIGVNVKDDNRRERDETLTVELTDADGAVIADIADTAVGTIIDND
ncbi:MAG: S8 family serine peptidase [Acidimicrobiaceae bacterium]|nr:S8 family serine peptidase [Acidimicrobiaceae bacterium]